MKKAFVLLAMLLTVQLFAQTSNNLHGFVVMDIEGKSFNLSALKGKKVLVVNTASKCGLTPQYEELEKLYQTYKDKNFIIIGFPANNFMKQEPGTNEEIAEFCQKNYGVSFPMMAKISVKGDDIHPFYQWLTQKAKNGKEDADVQWNFQKFMIDESGNWVGYVSPKTKPFDNKIVSWIEQ
jgi:glutathione peroxidase